MKTGFATDVRLFYSLKVTSFSIFIGFREDAYYKTKAKAVLLMKLIQNFRYKNTKHIFIHLEQVHR